MKIFIAYRFTGENLAALKIILSRIKSIFEEKGADSFCSLFFDEHFKSRNFSSDEIYDFCLEQVLAHDLVLFLIKSNDRSRGMELELERSILHGKRMALAIRRDLKFDEFRSSAHQIIEFSDLSDLYERLRRLKVPW